MANTGPTAWNSPDVFVGKPIIQNFEPYPVLSGTQYSSNAPSNAGISRWVNAAPMYVKNIILQNSLAAGVPAATSAASAGSEAYSYGVTAFLYSRQDYSANSTNLWPLTTASFGLTATMTYTSTSQQFGMSWLTDSTGGTSNLTTTSADAGWSVFINGPRVFAMPFVTTLTAGEYWMAIQHSSTTNTSNSNVTLMSMSQFGVLGQQSAGVAGYLGQTTTNVSVQAAPMDVGVVGGTPTSSTTMGYTFGGGMRPVWFSLVNA